MEIKQSHKLLRLLSGKPQRDLNGSSTHFQLKKQSLLLHLRFARLGIFKILKGRHHTAILGSGLVYLGTLIENFSPALGAKSYTEP